MTNIVKRQRFSKSEWLEAGLKMLSEQGVDKLTIGSLSRTVGVAKTSFYWHFKDRQDLLNHMLEYWISVFNVIVTDEAERNLLLALEPEPRLYAIVGIVLDRQLVKYELAIRAWGSHDASALAAFDDMYHHRMEVLCRVFADAGFDDTEQNNRAQIFNCYLTWGNVMQHDAVAHKRILHDLIPILMRPDV